jgi:hypothetical protein
MIVRAKRRPPSEWCEEVVSEIKSRGCKPESEEVYFTINTDVMRRAIACKGRAWLVVKKESATEGVTSDIGYYVCEHVVEVGD